MKRLYTEKQTVFATFLGGPVPAGILMYKNFIRFGKEKQAYISIALTLIFTISFGFVILKLSDEILEKLPSPLITSFYGLIAAILYNRFLAKEVKTAIGDGAQRASNWSVAGFTVLGLVINLLIIFGIAYSKPPFSGEKLVVGNSKHEIYYNTTTISEAEVQKLGDELIALGVFTDEVPQTVYLGSSGERYALTIPVQLNSIEDTELATEMKALTWSLEDAFGKPFTITLESYNLTGKRTVKSIE